ncbi:MAG TPA: hypothetical protein VHY22_14950 [Chthoniobacteraceae bacterium]|jgi:hypothetical protein|nr:hypothetical protein [Chthoniobacteraceae bacterium]
MPEDFDELSKLLRLKRFEQPPPAYFEDFLDDFKDRQRAQLLREPAWRIAWDRVTAFFGGHSAARIGYGLASAAVLVIAGVTSFNILQTRPTPEMAALPAPHPAAQQASYLSLNTQAPMPGLPTLDSRMAQMAAGFPPRYVMDARPVSYEQPPSSF